MLCAIEGCESPIEARGWCSLHYTRWRKHGDPAALHHRGPRPGSHQGPQQVAQRAAGYRRWLGTPEGQAFRARMSEKNRGSNHPQWKGDDVTYKAAHYRVRSARGAPPRCERCGTTEGRLEWANVSGNLLDVDDYIGLCKRCHADFDADRHIRDPVTGRFLPLS